MNKNSFEASKGFTLVELMVVIAIIGILAVVALGIVRGAQTRAKDATIQSTASNITTALESSYAINNVYPNALQDLVDDGVLSDIPSLADPCTVGEGADAPATCGINYDVSADQESYTLHVRYQVNDADADGQAGGVVDIEGGKLN